jgi:sporulation protein YlmC with PRC-barrel domain
MLKSLSLSVPILALAGGLAFAQMQTDRQPANSEHSMSSLASNHWLASDIYKASVYDPSNNKIGSIEDLVLDTSGQVQTVVIGVGGFLGIGQKDVAVPFGELKVASRNGKEELVLNRTKEQLKDAPAYDKAAKAD